MRNRSHAFTVVSASRDNLKQKKNFKSTALFRYLCTEFTWRESAAVWHSVHDDLGKECLLLYGDRECVWSTGPFLIFLQLIFQLHPEMCRIPCYHDNQDLSAWNFLLLSHRGQPFVYTIAALPTPSVVDRTKEVKVACVAPTGTSAHVTCAQTVMRFVKSISAKDSYFNWGSL